MEKIWDSLLNGKSELTLAEYEDLNIAVNNSELNRIKFLEKVEELSRSGKKNIATKVGIGYCVAGKFEEALELLNDDSNSGISNYCRAKSLIGIGRKSDAIEVFKKASEKIDNPAAVELERILVLIDCDMIEQAGSTLNTLSSALSGKNAEFHSVYGKYFEKIGEYEKAAESYEKALDIDNDHVGTLFRFAYMLDLHGNSTAALELYKKITQANPINVNALLNMAVLYEDEQNFENAISCVNLVLKYHPNHSRARLFKKDIMSSTTMLYDEEQEYKKSNRSKILEKPISEYELSVRSRNCLKKMDINSIGDLLKISEQELLNYKNFGETSLTEIRCILESEGLRLGMFHDEDDDGMPMGQPMQEVDNEMIIKSIGDLELSVRARRAVDRLGIKTFGELISKSEAELLGCKNFGVTSLTEIKEKLSKYNLRLKKQD